MARVILFEDERGYVIAEGNEFTIGSKIDDPPKVRVGSQIFTHGGGGGVISFSRMRSSGVCFGDQQDEIAMIRVEQAEDVRGQTSNRKAEFNFMVSNGDPSVDVVKPLAFTWDTVTRILAGFRSSLAAKLGGGGRTDTMWAPDGLSFTQQQSDGNFVTYTIDAPFDKSANPRPVWSAWTGKIDYPQPVETP
jgi:hypothetical protein